MKAIKKSTLLELADYTREYARTGKINPPSAGVVTAKELAKQAYGSKNRWMSIVDFVDATIGVYALYPECTDEELCELFRALKFEVLADV